MQNNIFSGLFVGQNLVTIKEVDSTNNFLKSILSNSKPLIEGTVIMAEGQSAGRGQQQNRWYSETGKNLTFSILIKPSFLAITDQFDLTRMVSLGVFNALKPLLGEKLKIKWPNDIYYGDNKLGGILIENMIQGKQIKNSIIGIGINVNQESFPDEVPNAISIKQILHKDYDIRTILSEICGHIEAAYLNLKAGKVSFIREQYLNLLYGLGENRSFEADGLIFNGIIKNVKPNGLLIVQKDNEEIAFNFKEVAFINK